MIARRPCSRPAGIVLLGLPCLLATNEFVAEPGVAIHSAELIVGNHLSSKHGGQMAIPKQGGECIPVQECE